MELSGRRSRVKDLIPRHAVRRLPGGRRAAALGWGLPGAFACGRRKGESAMPSRDLDGRGTRLNPANRFERLHVDLTDSDEEPGALSAPVPTELYRDATRSALSENDSPDLGFRFSLNP